MKTQDKIILGFLVILMIGLSSFLITAITQGVQSASSDEVSAGSIKLINNNQGNVLLVPEDESVKDEEVERPITGSALEQASAVALKYVGEGRVTDTEIGDEEGYYEIEITLEDGSEADVHLDENFKVLSVEIESDEDDDDD